MRSKKSSVGTTFWNIFRKANIKTECEACGAKTSLVLHHKRYRGRFLEQPEDVHTLCEGCHNTLHSVVSTDPLWLLTESFIENKGVLTETQMKSVSRKIARQNKKIRRKREEKELKELKTVETPSIQAKKKDELEYAIRYKNDARFRKNEEQKWLSI